MSVVSVVLLRLSRLSGKVSIYRRQGDRDSDAADGGMVCVHFRRRRSFFVCEVTDVCTVWSKLRNVPASFAAPIVCRYCDSALLADVGALEVNSDFHITENCISCMFCAFSFLNTVQRSHIDENFPAWTSIDGWDDLISLWRSHKVPRIVAKRKLYVF